MDTERLIEAHEQLGHALEQAQRAAACLQDLRSAVEHLALLEPAYGMAYNLQAQALFQSAESCLHLALLQLLRARKVFDAAQEVSGHDT